jgi:hypothetical protein
LTNIKIFKVKFLKLNQSKSFIHWSGLTLSKTEGVGRKRNLVLGVCSGWRLNIHLILENDCLYNITCHNFVYQNSLQFHYFCWGFAVESSLCRNVIVIIVLADEFVKFLIGQLSCVTFDQFLHLVCLAAYRQSPFL